MKKHNIGQQINFSTNSEMNFPMDTVHIEQLCLHVYANNLVEHVKCAQIKM